MLRSNEVYPPQVGVWARRRLEKEGRQETTAIT